MRVLVTGGKGQLGIDLVNAFEGHDVVAAGHGELDVSDRDQVLQAVGGLQPDAIVHAGAWTAVDACESDRDWTFAVNGLGTRHVAEAAARAGARVCYVSTDYVFDGTSTQPYTEWETPNPQSVYGQSKLAGETELFRTLGGPDATVVRTSWVCGAHGSNMVKTILRLAGEHDRLTFVDDQRGHPTFTEDLATMIRRLVIERRPGLFHVTNQGATTWFEFAREVLAAAGMDPERVDPIATADLEPARPAPRPANSVLENAALRLSGVPLLSDHHEPLERTVKELCR